VDYRARATEPDVIPGAMETDGVGLKKGKKKREL
jgi:hypothetical protein